MMTALEFWRDGRRTNNLLTDMLDNFYNLDREFEANGLRKLNSGFRPACNVSESEQHYILSFDMPGVNKNDIQLEIKEDYLIVSGERKHEEEVKEGKFHRIERSFGSFKRAFQLPKSIKAEQVKANYENGVLKIAVPKAAEASESKKIEIGSGAKSFFDRLTGTSSGKITKNESPAPKAEAANG